jgi:chaperone BCS1
MKLQIDYNDCIFKAILYYGVLHSDNKYSFNIASKRPGHHRDDESDNSEYGKSVVLRLPFGNSLLKYKNVNIDVDIEKLGPLPTENEISVYSNMYLYTPDEHKDILMDFIKNAKAYYITNVLDKKKEVNKVTVYIWEDYWDVLHKHPQRNLETIYLKDDIKEQLVDKIENFIKPETEELYNKFGIPYKINILLEGYPGTGKTSIIYAIASYLELSVAILNFDKDMTDIKFMRALRRLPEKTILILEDIDVLFRERKENDTHTSVLTFSGLLNCLDGIASSYKQMVFMTTNYKCNLDKALYRPGRIDFSVHFDYADKIQTEKMYSIFYPNKPDQFTRFYAKIKHCKLTTAMLQQYFFRNIYNDDILENIDELIEMSKLNNYDCDNEHLYS